MDWMFGCLECPGKRLLLSPSENPNVEYGVIFEKWMEWNGMEKVLNMCDRAWPKPCADLNTKDSGF